MRSMTNITVRDGSSSSGTAMPGNGPEDTCSITLRRSAGEASQPLLCRSEEKFSLPQKAHFHWPVSEETINNNNNDDDYSYSNIVPEALAEPYFERNASQEAQVGTGVAVDSCLSSGVMPLKMKPISRPEA